MTSRNQHISKSNGFTLVELVIVVVILAIVSGAVGTIFLDRDEYDQRFYYDDLLTALRFAQKSAVATACDTGVDITTTGYVVYRRASCTSGNLDQVITHPGKDPNSGVQNYNYQNTNLPSGLVVSSNVDPIVFDSLGRAKTLAGAVSNVSITVGTRTITIVGETGLVFNPNG
jgi:MSHA pilin protein MshC